MCVGRYVLCRNEKLNRIFFLKRAINTYLESLPTQKRILVLKLHNDNNGQVVQLMGVAESVNIDSGKASFIGLPKSHARIKGLEIQTQSCEQPSRKFSQKDIFHTKIS